MCLRLFFLSVPHVSVSDLCLILDSLLCLLFILYYFVGVSSLLFCVLPLCLLSILFLFSFEANVQTHFWLFLILSILNFVFVFHAVSCSSCPLKSNICFISFGSRSHWFFFCVSSVTFYFPSFLFVCSLFAVYLSQHSICLLHFLLSFDTHPHPPIGPVPIALQQKF